MLKTLINHFSLQENSEIYNYILPIIDEHKDLLQNIEKLGYSLDEDKLRENLRDGNIFIELFENEKFTNIIQNLAGSECILQFYFCIQKRKKCLDREVLLNLNFHIIHFLEVFNHFFIRHSERAKRSEESMRIGNFCFAGFFGRASEGRISQEKIILIETFSFSSFGTSEVKGRI